MGALPERRFETRDESLRPFGDDWIRGGRSAVLMVPSTAIRAEWNVLLHPAHREFDRVGLGEPRAFSFDRRIFRQESLCNPYVPFRTSSRRFR
jgi:RES domain-containing protein